MIKLIVGNKGSGKTKILIDMINHSLQTSDGNVVCIERGMKLTYEINHNCRLIDAEEYGVEGFDMFLCRRYFKNWRPGLRQTGRDVR